jgi:hypothetical protein
MKAPPPSSSNEPEGEPDLGAPIGFALLGLYLAGIGLLAGADSSYQTPLFLTALPLMSLASMGFFFELAKGNDRESYRDFGAVFALVGIAALLAVLLRSYNYSSWIEVTMEFASVAVGGIGVVGLGIGLQRLLREQSQSASRNTAATRTPMTHYERLSLLAVTVIGALTVLATILAAYIQKG